MVKGALMEAEEAENHSRVVENNLHNRTQMHPPARGWLVAAKVARWKEHRLRRKGKEMIRYIKHDNPL
jgi:hypothetical protein